MGYGSVLIVRRQARNNDGDLAGAPTDVVHGGWDIAPESSTEDGDGGRGSGSGTRTATTTRLQAFGGPRSPDIRPGDRVYLAADDRAGPPPWDVVGDPESWAQDRGSWVGGTVVTLQRVTH